MRNARDARAARRNVSWTDFDAFDTKQQLWSFARDESTGESDERAALVRNAVHAVLSPKQREVVEAYFFDGLSQEQIAERLGISQQVVQRRLHGVMRRGRRIGGALARLRTALAPVLCP
jgi:RNA polymerase sigma factor (sigma-70 family)